jgi:hypothetical protein
MFGNGSILFLADGKYEYELQSDQQQVSSNILPFELA